MLPIRDTIRSNSFPLVNWLIVGLNTMVFLLELAMPAGMLDALINVFGMVPARLHLTQPWALLASPLTLLTLVTHSFLHGGWIHFLSNMWVLIIFGDNVEDRLGSLRYILFYLLGGVAAALVQAWVDPASQLPAIGASGAIAAVMGGYLVLYPRARVITLIPLFFIPWFIEVNAVVFLGLWFVTQFFSGYASLAQAAGGMGGVAWFAHIGGFIFGLIAVRLFAPSRTRAYTRVYPDEYYPW